MACLRAGRGGSGRPPRPPGPWPRRPWWSRRRLRPLSEGSCALPSFGRRVSTFRNKRWLCGSGPPPSMVPKRPKKPRTLRRMPFTGGAPRGDPRLNWLWSACLASSTGCGLAAPTFRPVVPHARRPGVRRGVVIAVVPRARHQPPFGPLRNRSGTFGHKCDPWNNCWRWLGVFSFCF